MKYDKSTLVSAWKRRSCQDMNAAVLLHEQGDLEETSLFHLQQCAEKGLKAYLVHCEINFPHTHDLSRLVYIASQEDA